MHRIVVQTIVLDVTSKDHQRTRDFWEGALAAERRREVNRPEYHDLDYPASPCRIVVQDVGEAESRIHLDIETDDLPAEVERLIKAGATEVSRQHHWVVLRDPAGMLFCVVSRPPWPPGPPGQEEEPAVFLHAKSVPD